jgi:N-acetylneuraminic acid mutarotase
MMKLRMLLEILVCLGALAGLAASVRAQTTAANEWTWMGGSNSVSSGSNGQPGVYGTLGSGAIGNIPGGRDNVATWTDRNGNFWLFGGEGIDVNGNFGVLNDLWEFSPSTNQWTWIGGSSAVPASCAGNTSVACGQSGVYGTIGSASATNIPGGRAAASFWTDSSGNFWLFGGSGFGSGQDLGELNDLWKFNP